MFNVNRRNNQFLYDTQGETWSDSRILAALPDAYEYLRTFKSSYRIYELHTRYQTDHIGPQPIQPNFKFSVVVAGAIFFALV